MSRIGLTREQVDEYTRVAYYYYKVGMTQDEIAKYMKMSRQRVNRIIRDCVGEGIVQIKIANLENSFIELESKLERKYQLKVVRVVENLIEEDLYNDLGKVAGDYLKSIIKDNDIIAFSRGRSASAVVDQLPIIRKNNLVVTQLLGSENHESKHQGVDDIVYRCSEKLQATANMLYAPAIVQSKEVRETIESEKSYKKSYSVIKSSTIAVVGIGVAKRQWKHMMEIYEEDVNMQENWMQEVKGEVSTHFFDKDGNPVTPSFRNRMISIDLEDYLKIPTRIGVAGELSKVNAIKAALKGGYINVLVTDLKTAEKLCEQE